MTGSSPTSGEFPGEFPGDVPQVDDITDVDRRNDLRGLSGVPATDPVGLIDASTDATTQQANVLIDDRVDLALDTFVVTAQRLVDGSVLFHYGIVTEVSGRVEGAELATDTARLAAATLPGQRFRHAEVSWIRTDPERYLPPSSGARIWIAEADHRRRALFLDKMSEDEQIPLGLDMGDEPVYMPYSFLNGDKGGHVSISGKSGVATKTSYALYLLYTLFETEFGRRARRGSAHDRALVFSVKGSDLCLLDKPNNRFVDTDPVGVEARRQWRLLGVADPRPFTDLEVFAPAEDSDPGVTPVPHIEVRDKRETSAYGWSPRTFIERGLLEFVFDDLESGQLSFIEQVVRVQLLRWCCPLAGDTEGRVVLVHPDDQDERPGSTWESAARALRRKRPVGAGSGVVIATLDELVEFIGDKVTEGSPGFEPLWTGSVTGSTTQAFIRRLWKSTPRLRRLVRAGLAEVGLSSQVSVVDVHALHADAQRFVVASVLSSVWEQHENSTAAGRTFVVLDELNKYAPRSGGSPIKSLLVDIAARGRSLGVILIGAQQNPSGVDRDITNNAALEVVGQLKASESSELGFLPAAMRARAQIIAPGTMITSQPLLPAPVPIRFPFPPYATRVSEVLGSAADDAEARALLEDM
ncbi:MAG: ATP-binding protein [Microthrixaceae bacterium]